jgi:ABC-type transporter Mla MlaB component
MLTLSSFNIVNHIKLKVISYKVLDLFELYNFDIKIILI